MFYPLAFGNHNDKCQGFGLNSLASVKPGETIVKIKTRMSLTSDNIIDTVPGLPPAEESKEDDELYKALLDHTRKTARHMNPGDPANANRIYQHLSLTQKLIALTRKEFEFTPQSNLLKAWFNVLPKHDLSQMIFWD
jgi:tRNA A37 N6-isopentenylltransferase MiaA